MKIFLFIIMCILILIGTINAFFNDDKGLTKISFFLAIIFFIISYFYPKETMPRKEETTTEMYTETTTEEVDSFDDSIDNDSDEVFVDDFNESNSMNDSITIESDYFNGVLTYDGQEVYYSFIPSISGIYRFDFDSNDYNTNYDFYIYTYNNEKIASSCFSSKGITVELKADIQYIIVVEQYNGYPEYSVSIGIPKKIQLVNDNKFEGSLLYLDQVDSFSYTAPLSGRYRFDFSTDDVQSKYIFQIYSSKNELLGDAYDYNNGITLLLDAGETYTIYIIQNNGFPTYNVEIHVPNEITIINDKSFSGTITYIDQLDCYSYTAPLTGKYRFDFVSGDVQNNYIFYIYASDNTEIVYSSFIKGGETVNLIGGENYMIEIEQKEGIENYTINIGVPNETVSINDDFFGGTISFIDQENIYTYIAPLTGKYTFTFDSDNDKSDYKFIITSSTNEDIGTSYYANGSKTVNLVQNEIYSIKIIQSNGFVSYQVNISIE